VLQNRSHPLLNWMIKRFFIIPDPEGDNKTRSHHLLNWMIKRFFIKFCMYSFRYFVCIALDFF
jgi:hypothetical protein